jgi:hypothetical protein
MKAVLKQAGDNRKQLEKVLKHYSRNPADSLKLRAAEFLILNMPGKYSEYYDAPWNDVAAQSMRWTSSPNKQGMLSAYGLGELVRKDDLTHITAKYLINNIELAFKVWQERPWGKHIPFDVFCEDILPYRVGMEPLENWREKALASFADLEEKFNSPDMTAVEACAILNELLPRFRVDKDFPAMNFSQLMASARGMCDNMAALAIFSMRAWGIPVTFEFSPKWIGNTVGHSWNSVRDCSGKYIHFMGAEANPYQYFFTHSSSKVYRKTYALQNGIKATENNVPRLLNNTNRALDVTSNYMDVSDVTVRIKYPSAESTDYVYLAYQEEDQWHPIAWDRNSGQTANFTSMKNELLYLPVYYVGGHQSPAGDPFWLDKNGNKTSFSADTQNSRDTLLILQGISPSNPNPHFSRMDGGGIYEGNDYELFHWTQNGWKSLGIQKAKSNTLQYRVPLQALFYVANHTLRKNGTTFFTTSDNKIQWTVPQ